MSRAAKPGCLQPLIVVVVIVVVVIVITVIIVIPKIASSQRKILAQRPMDVIR